MAEERPLKPWQRRLHEIIFEADTPAGKAFDVGLLITIILSVIVVMLESMPIVRDLGYEPALNILEWVFTIVFTIEYIARILVLGRPWSYIFSFFGIIDLLSILPTYIGLFLPQGEYLLVIRTLRLLRVFRVLKLVRFLREANSLINALKASRAKITVFITAVLILVIIFGTLMYLIEGQEPNSKFDSIPRSIYWAIVTLTTVGYGDISPVTDLGQFISAIIMILGYAIIAVPTGIVSAEIVSQAGNSGKAQEVSTQACMQCGKEGHEPDAEFCKYCGAKL